MSDKEPGFWHGDMSARLKNVEKEISRIQDDIRALLAMKTQHKIMWAAVTGLAIALGSAIFKIWSAGMFS